MATRHVVQPVPEQLGAEDSERVPFYKKWKGIALCVVALMALLTIDATRREGEETKALVVNAAGAVQVQPAGQATLYNEKGQGAALGPGDTITTGPNANATIWMAGGVTAVLEPNTRFTIRLIDYYRRERLHDQSFLVAHGRVWCHVPPSFGSESRMDVCTPTTVATIHPGTTFSLQFEAASRWSYLRVIDGFVDYASPAARMTLSKRDGVLAQWYQLGEHQVMTAEQLAEAEIYEQILAQYQQTPSYLLRVERGVADVVYTPLGWIGVGPKSWITASFDTAARTRAQQAMRQLHTHLIDTLSDGAPDFPETLNPITLEELRLPEKDRNKILLSLAGNRIELYQQYGRGYRLTAFAKDHAHTAYEINHKGTVQKIDNRRARTIRAYRGDSNEL